MTLLLAATLLLLLLRLGRCDRHCRCQRQQPQHVRMPRVSSRHQHLPPQQLCGPCCRRQCRCQHLRRCHPRQQRPSLLHTPRQARVLHQAPLVALPGPRWRPTSPGLCSPGTCAGPSPAPARFPRCSTPPAPAEPAAAAPAAPPAHRSSPVRTPSLLRLRPARALPSPQACGPCWWPTAAPAGHPRPPQRRRPLPPGRRPWRRRA
ncbi:hypothetical protein COO60DRAFT_1492558 [Scenedesmus sp. NREL 46B-D3]|nr:hypothetical protein COO60DRAFT_1492558 [Scenedesmus sp. NREL 46B-D3]